MTGLATNWVKLANGTNVALFKIGFGEPKFTETYFIKTQHLFPFGANLTQFGANLAISAYISRVFQAGNNLTLILTSILIIMV